MNGGRLLVENRFLRTIIAFALLGFMTLAPYGAFVKFVALRGVPNLAETVPGDYYFIQDASIPLGHMLAFDLAGIMDKLRTGDYLAQVPRWPNVSYMILMFLPLLWGRVRRSNWRSTSRFGHFSMSLLPPRFFLCGLRWAILARTGCRPSTVLWPISAILPMTANPALAIWW